MIAVTQARGIGPGKSYLDKLQASGKTRTESLRLLRRHLSDAVFTALRTDNRAHARPSVPQATPDASTRRAA